MLDRFETYNINQYEFQWVSAVVINSETIEVTTKLLVDFNKKGSSTRLVVDVSPDPVIVWKRYGTDWLLKTGLPYTKNELGGF
jgi:hypothetical protein